MASHDWSRVYDEGAGTVKDGICIWCDAQPGTEGDCPTHPRAGARSIPRSIVDDFIGDRLAEIRKAEGRL